MGAYVDKDHVLGWVLGLRVHPGWFPGQLARWAESGCSSAWPLNIWCKSKTFFQPGQEFCLVGFGTRPGRANTALIEALLDF